MKNLVKFSLLMLVVSSCICHGKNLTEQYKKEIIETEKAFAEMTMTEGMAAAFLYYAAEDAVINRSGIISGKDSIEAWFSSWDQTGIQLEWETDFVDVSKSGDLGYTYGSFTATKSDSTGSTDKSTGIFHTVWKRQPDGQWRFVWD